MSSSASEKYEISAIPAPVPDAHLNNYISIRLFALRTDPDSFSSSYAKETEFSLDQWRSRIDPSHRATFFATHSIGMENTRLACGEWAALLSTLSPDFFSSVNYKLPSTLSVSSLDNDFYVLVGLWVHPSHRRRGLARRLINASIDWVRKKVSSDGKTLLLVEVHRANEAAIDLYRKTGFESVGEDESQQSIWMSFPLNAASE
ncbi:hypothetical protein K435DRAFT_672065 [Dendrothele bispora CBS 962.96]|uniref:N-acetyltransferase domain-containing protein n=1 Tax=Dendrothele bispora (strain CBS 962.96) TaxID=1314807 RepID=A0A4S8LTR9_DENBC|nr:hypothetical protein K435DRAFT_672065 [Dendrothele bispora CBS 962.96]